MNKFKSLKKAHKIVIISVLAVLIVAAGTATAFAIKAERERAAHAAAVEELKANFEIKINELDEIEQSALALTLGAYLAEDITGEKINELRDVFSSLTDIEVEEKYQEDVKEQSEKLAAAKNTVSVIIESVRSKFDTQTAVNTLFTVPALVGDKVAENLVIADDLDTAKLEEVKKQLGINESTEVETPENIENSESKNEESSASEVSEDVNAADEIDEWGNTIHILISEAEAQVKHVDYVKSEIAKHLIDGNLVADSGLNPDIVNNTKAIAEQIKNETIRTALAEQAKQIETLYNEKIRVAAEAQAAEVGGTAEKQENGTYKVVASDNSEYAVSNTGEVTKTKDAPPAASYSSGSSSKGSSSGSGSASSSGGNSAGSSGGGSSNSGSTGSSGGSSNTGGQTSWSVEADSGGYVAGGYFGGDGDNTWTGGSFDPGNSIDTSGWFGG